MKNAQNSNHVLSVKKRTITSRMAIKNKNSEAELVIILLTTMDATSK